MKDNKSRFTLRLDEEVAEKLAYIAEYEGRTKSKEVERLIRRHIAEFEREHGTIDLTEWPNPF